MLTRPRRLLHQAYCDRQSSQHCQLSELMLTRPLAWVREESPRRQPPHRHGYSR